MPSGKCRGCGKITNSACSNWWFCEGEGADECYAAFVDDKWVKGCKYENAQPPMKMFTDHMLKEEKEKNAK